MSSPDLLTLGRSKHQRHAEARKIFTEIHTKHLDWPEAIWEAWTAFEHLYGSVDEIEFCLDKIEGAQYQTNMRRTKVRHHVIMSSDLFWT